jgi:hypothetical protein
MDKSLEAAVGQLILYLALTQQLTMLQGIFGLWPGQGQEP